MLALKPLTGYTVVDKPSDERSPLDNPEFRTQLSQGVFYAIVKHSGMSSPHYQHCQVMIPQYKNWVSCMEWHICMGESPTTPPDSVVINKEVKLHLESVKGAVFYHLLLCFLHPQDFCSGHVVQQCLT